MRALRHNTPAAWYWTPRDHAHARLARNKHIKRTPPRRQSFKRFWREQAGHPALEGKPRWWRRAMVLAWYRADKRVETW